MKAQKIKATVPERPAPIKTFLDKRTRTFTGVQSLQAAGWLYGRMS